MKKCPFCAEAVQTKAIICKHCKNPLPVHKTLLEKGMEIHKEVKSKEADKVSKMSDEERRVYSNEQRRKWGVGIFWFLAVSIALPVYVEPQSPWAMWIGFLILLVGIWIHPLKGENWFGEGGKAVQDRLKHYKIRKFRTGLSVVVFLFATLSFSSQLMQTIEQKKILAYPQPTLEILSPAGDQGDSKEYELKVKALNATHVWANLAPMVQDPQDAVLFSLALPLDSITQTIGIRAKNEYKEANKTILVTRAETEQESQERLAREAKEAFGTADKETEAFICAKNKVESMLKSPKTADFPLLDFKSAYLGYDKYQIESYVDAQNDYSAMLRTNYRCIVEVIEAKEFNCISQSEFY